MKVMPVVVAVQVPEIEDVAELVDRREERLLVDFSVAALGCDRLHEDRTAFAGRPGVGAEHAQVEHDAEAARLEDGVLLRGPRREEETDVRDRACPATCSSSSAASATLRASEWAPVAMSAGSRDTGSRSSSSIAGAPAALRLASRKYSSIARFPSLGNDAGRAMPSPRVATWSRSFTGPGTGCCAGGRSGPGARPRAGARRGPPASRSEARQ